MHHFIVLENRSQSGIIKMDHDTDYENLNESVEELKIKLEAMKRMIEINEKQNGQRRVRQKGAIGQESIFTGRLMSVIFIIALIIVIFATVYGFSSLYYAVSKKYSRKKYSEL